MYYYSATVGSSLSSPTATKVLSQGDNKTGHIVILLYLSIFGGGQNTYVFGQLRLRPKENIKTTGKLCKNVLKLEKYNLRQIVLRLL